LNESPQNARITHFACFDDSSYVYGILSVFLGFLVNEGCDLRYWDNVKRGLNV